MGVIPFSGVVSFSAEHPANRVKNLLPGGHGKWTCPTVFTEKSIEVEFSLPPSFIEAIDIGNFGSASIEIQVNRSNEPANKRETLIMNSVLMTRIDWLRGHKKEGMTFFEKENMNPAVLDKWWDRLRVVCHQPFRTSNFDLFGLSAIVVRGRPLEAMTTTPERLKTSNKNSLATGAEDLMKKMDKHVSKLASPPTSSEILCLENSRFSNDTVAATLKSPLSRTGRLMQQSIRQTSDVIKESNHGKSKTSQKRLLSDFDESSRNSKTGNSTSIDTQTSRDNRESPFKKARLQKPSNPLQEQNLEESKLNPVIRHVEKGKNLAQQSHLVEDIDVLACEDDPATFKNFSTENLISRGILVQHRTYKKAKDLPLIGGQTVFVEKGQPLTFYKCGPKIYMELSGKIYLPEVEPEYVANLFRDYSDIELAQCDYPRKQSATSLVCPLCPKRFLLENELVTHAANCDGSSTSSSSSEGSCPICNTLFRLEDLEAHAQECAQSFFD